MTAKCGAGVLQETRVFDCCRADDDVAQAGIEVALNRVEVADATSQLHIDQAAHILQDFPNGGLVLRVARKRSIEVHQMQPARTLVHPIAGHHDGIFAKGGGLAHIALFEANTVTVFQVNRRN